MKKILYALALGCGLWTLDCLASTFVATNDLGSAVSVSFYGTNSAGAYTFAAGTNIAAGTSNSITSTNVWLGVSVSGTNVTGVARFDNYTTLSNTNGANISYLITNGVIGYYPTTGASTPGGGISGGSSFTNTPGGPVTNGISVNTNAAPGAVSYVMSGSLFYGTNNPNGVVPAPFASIYNQFDQTWTNFVAQYVKTTTTGSNGWVLATTQVAGSGTSYNFSTNFSVTGTTNVDVISVPFAAMAMYGPDGTPLITQSNSIPSSQFAGSVGNTDSIPSYVSLADVAAVATNALNASATIVAYTNGTFCVNLPYLTNYFSVSRTNMLQAVFDAANAIANGGVIELKAGAYLFTTNLWLNRSISTPCNWKVIGYGAIVHYVGETNLPYEGGVIETAGAGNLDYVPDVSGNPSIFNFTFEGITFGSDCDWSGWGSGVSKYLRSDNRRFFEIQQTAYLGFINCRFQSSNTMARSLTTSSAFGYNARPSGLVWINDVGQGNRKTEINGCWFAGGAVGVSEFNDNWEINGNTFSECGAWDDGAIYYGGTMVSSTNALMGTTLQASVYNGLGDNGNMGGAFVTRSGQYNNGPGNYAFAGNIVQFCNTPIVDQAYNNITLEHNIFLTPVEVLFGENPASFIYGELILLNNYWGMTGMAGFTNIYNQPALAQGVTSLLTNELATYFTIGIPEDLSGGGTAYDSWIWAIAQNGTNYLGVDWDGVLHWNSVSADGSGLTNLQASGVSTNGSTTGQVMINGGNGTVVWTNNQSVVAAGDGETAEKMTTNPVTGQVTYTSNVNTNQFLASTGNSPFNGSAITNLNMQITASVSVPLTNGISLTNFTIADGLTNPPGYLRGVLVCITNDSCGLKTNSETPLDEFCIFGGGASRGPLFSVSADSTGTNIVFNYCGTIGTASGFVYDGTANVAIQSFSNFKFKAYYHQ